MAGVSVVKLNEKGVGELLKSGGVQSAVAGVAAKVAAAAGSGYGSDSQVGKTRARASAFARTFDARRHPERLIAGLSAGRAR